MGENKLLKNIKKIKSLIIISLIISLLFIVLFSPTPVAQGYNAKVVFDLQKRVVSIEKK